MKYSRRALLAIVVSVGMMRVVAFAHEMIVRGTVAAIEPTRIQVKTGDEKAGQSPAWYPIDAKTKIKRGTKTMTFAEARIVIDERVVAIIDHPTKGPMTTKEIRLAPQAPAGGHRDAKYDRPQSEGRCGDRMKGYAEVRGWDIARVDAEDKARGGAAVGPNEPAAESLGDGSCGV